MSDSTVGFIVTYGPVKATGKVGTHNLKKVKPIEKIETPSGAVFVWGEDRFGNPRIALTAPNSSKILVSLPPDSLVIDVEDNDYGDRVVSGLECYPPDTFIELNIYSEEITVLQRFDEKFPPSCELESYAGKCTYLYYILEPHTNEVVGEIDSEREKIKIRGVRDTQGIISWTDWGGKSLDFITEAPPITPEMICKRPPQVSE